MIQQVLAARAEGRIEREFGWERLEDTGATGLFAPDAPEFLEERELGWITDDFLDLDRLNSLETSQLGSGHFACVHQLGDTDVVAKRYYPFVYDGGHEGENKLRGVSGSSILRDLIVNLALERSLADDPTYTTPQYLGHLMLDGAGGDVRHYTLMSMLDIVDNDEFRQLPKEVRDRDYDLRQNFEAHCRGALNANGYRSMMANFDLEDHHGNMPAIRDPETGELKIGVIDAETYIKWHRPVSGDLVAYLHTDPDAPWLSVDRFGFGAES